MSDDMISVLAKQSEELTRQGAEIASLRAAVLEICQVAVEKDRQCKVLARENERLRIGALTIAGHPELHGTKGAEMARALVKE